MSPLIKDKKIVIGLARWGDPGVALLPKSLRDIWTSDRLPTWLAAEIGLHQEATLAWLGEDVSRKLQHISPRLRNYLAWLVRSRKTQIKNAQVIGKLIPAALDLDRIPWTVRTRNCLNSMGLLHDPATLAKITFGELFDIGSMGAYSILDFACTLEAAIGCLAALENNTPSLPDSILSAAKQPWAEQVSEQDPRFAHLFPAGEGTIIERLDSFISTPLFVLLDKPQLFSAIQQAQQLVKNLANLPLETLLRQYLACLSRLTGKRLDALVARFGWGGSPPITLEQAGITLGVTRERIRQLESKIRGHIPNHPVVMPALDRAIELLENRVPISVSEATALLIRARITQKAFHPTSLIAAASDCGRLPVLTIEKTKKQEIVVSTKIEGSSAALISIARRQASASGASNILEVISQAEQKGISTDCEKARYVLSDHPDIHFLVGDWFWSPYGSRNRLRNVTRKMLSVASPIEVSSLRDGLRRTYRWRNSTGMRSWGLIVPPKNVLECFYRAHPEFSVDESGNVSSMEPLDFKKELAQTEEIIVNVLRSSPTCLLDREGLFKACLQRGLNENTLNIYTTYSPLVEHLGIDLWTLRGVRVDPTAVEALRQTTLQRPKEKRIMDYGWTPRSTLWIGTRLPSIVPGFVLSIPSAIKRFLLPGDFFAQSEDGLPAGVIKIGESGTSSGCNTYLSQHGADENDIFIVEFDLVEKKAILRLGNDDLLHEYSPDAA